MIRADLLAVKAELTNDPLTLGLTLLSADDEANANKLNAVSETILVKRRAVPTAEIVNAIDPLEHQSLSDQQSRWLDLVASLGQIDPFLDAGIVNGLRDLFSANSNSRPAIAAVFVQPGSRVEQLYQLSSLTFDADLTPSDVANARTVV